MANTKPAEGTKTRRDYKHAWQDRRKRKDSKKHEKILSSTEFIRKIAGITKVQTLAKSVPLDTARFQRVTLDK